MSDTDDLLLKSPSQKPDEKTEDVVDITDGIEGALLDYVCDIKNVENLVSVCAKATKSQIQTAWDLFDPQKRNVHLYKNGVVAIGSNTTIMISSLIDTGTAFMFRTCKRVVPEKVIKEIIFSSFRSINNELCALSFLEHLCNLHKGDNVVDSIYKIIRHAFEYPMWMYVFRNHVFDSQLQEIMYAMHAVVIEAIGAPNIDTFYAALAANVSVNPSDKPLFDIYITVAYSTGTKLTRIESGSNIPVSTKKTFVCISHDNSHYLVQTYRHIFNILYIGIVENKSKQLAQSELSCIPGLAYLVQKLNNT